MRIDIKEDPERLEYLSVKTAFLPKDVYSAVTHDPAMVFSWSVDASVSTDYHGESKSDGWHTVALVCYMA